MTEPVDTAKLAELYRRLGEAQASPWLTPELLASAAEGTLDAGECEQVARVLAQSPRQADLVRALVGLAPASRVLAEALAERQSEAGVAAGARSHARRRGHLRVVAAIPRHEIAAAARPPAAAAAAARAPRRSPRRLRWVAAAAVVAAVVGGFGWQGLHDVRPATATATATVAPAATPAPADTIFSTGMNGSLAGAKADVADEIFSSSFHSQKRG